jgi:cytoskeleton protein RodZ
MLGSTSEDYDRGDPAEALIREVGAQLRAVRLERGEDLDDVAKHLRIKPAYLFGIEQGDLSALPGRTYALGFLRTYADYLGFDGADLIARIKSSVGELTDRTRLRIRTPMPENRLPRTPMVVISLALVASIYLGWSYVNRTGRMASDTVAEVPEDLRAPTVVAAPQDAPAIEERTTVAATSDEGAPSAADASTAAVPGASSATPDAGSSGAMAARPGGRAPAAADDRPVGASGDAPNRMAGQPPPGGPAADDRLARSERDALSLQPAAGAQSSGAPTGAMPDERGLAEAETAAVDAPGAAVERGARATRRRARPRPKRSGRRAGPWPGCSWPRGAMKARRSTGGRTAMRG